MKKQVEQVVGENPASEVPRISLTVTEDEIVNCTIHFSVHSFSELQTAITTINKIDGVEEVHFVDERG